MTGPEHYSKAQKLADLLIRGMEADRRLTADEVARYAAAANVHATLALAAATAMAGRVGGPYDNYATGLAVCDQQAWDAVACSRKPGDW